MSSTLTFAENCKYTYSTEGSKLGWTAFKTAKKIGVKGEFTKFRFASLESISLVKLLEQSAFTLDASSVATGLPIRDKTIAKFFFGKLVGGTSIKGHVVRVEGDNVYVSIGMNDVTKTVKMTWKYQEDLIALTGKIDVMDFALGMALESIAKACKAKHKGKTWSDVELHTNIKIKKYCK
ncbi:YceI family protein [Bacteriovoracaceae bacterium]|nr:YceI family protein [Bacteriovoracaceae bacterium]